VASKLTTLSAQDMIRAMIAGERNPRTLALLARRTMKAKHDALVEALDGMFDDHHGELAQLLLDQIASLDTRIGWLDGRIAGGDRGAARGLGRRPGRDHRPGRRDQP